MYGNEFSDEEKNRLKAFFPCLTDSGRMFRKGTLMMIIDTPCFLMGDIHGKPEALEKFLRSRTGISLIQLGDCGFGFVPRYREVLEEMARETGNHVYCLRGNHDDPAMFRNPPVGEYFHLLSDYSELLLNGRRALAVGGGVSVDRSFRAPGRGWWEDEVIPWNGEFVAAHAGKIDILLTHVGLLPPSEPSLKEANPGLLDRDPDLRFDLPKERNLLMDLMEKLQPSEWYFAHFHVSATWQVNEKTRCRALKIDEIVEI